MITSFTILLFLVTMTCFGQSSDAMPRKWRYGVGAQMVVSDGGLAFPIYGKARWRFLEFGLSAGSRTAEIQDIAGFDLATTSGAWVEPNVQIMIPSMKSLMNKIDEYETGYLRIGGGLGYMSMENEFTKTFEALPPYEDYVYRESFKRTSFTYFRVNLGVHSDLFQRVNVGGGLSYMQALRSIDGNRGSHPKEMNPLNGSMNLGVYLELGVLF